MARAAAATSRGEDLAPATTSDSRPSSRLCTLRRSSTAAAPPSTHSSTPDCEPGPRQARYIFLPPLPQTGLQLWLDLGNAAPLFPTWNHAVLFASSI